MFDIYFILLVFCISIFVAALAHQPMLRYARKHNLYDNPEARKFQRKPVPVMGGFVVYLGAIIGSLCYWFKHDSLAIVPVQIAMLMMLLIGAWDDIKKLSPNLRLVLEILIVAALAIGNQYPINDFHGLWGIHEISPWIAWPLTIFACVGIINAINMIDGIDGLSSGICIMAFGFYGLLFFYAHDFVRVALSVAIIGSLIPFFIMNVFGNRSKMFIGDAGTMMLGIALCDMLMSMLTTNSACAQQVKYTDFCLIAFALAVLSVPVFDTLRVMFGRISRGESPFVPDKTHLHHAFIDYGFHHLETSLMEIMLNMMIIGLWWGIYKSHLSEQWQLYGVIVASIGVCFGLYWMLGRRKRIAAKVKEQYDISMEEYENLTDEEKKQLKSKLDSKKTNKTI
jgi:UDP-N-acetylmuramyl pentapeptide phosphotransferase/UDP-N-acetylglucosamine-1-phosphate transferase